MWKTLNVTDAEKSLHHNGLVIPMGQHQITWWEDDIAINCKADLKLWLDYG